MQRAIDSRILLRLGSAVLLGACALPVAYAQQPQAGSGPAYLNPSLPAEVRARDLVSRMTLDEKASQMVNQARAIPRLNVPAYDWWSESLHGVAVDGTTEFPEPIGLGATFDTDGIHEMATDISIEGRVVHAENAGKDGSSKIFHGLDFWAPNINIFRDPRWGRGQETYGEDPYLTGRMGVAFVTGMQGDNTKYYRVISTPKHFDVHSGPEPTRHFADVDVSLHDELDTYQPAFRAAITEGHAGSVMCAYNAIKGEPACANTYLLKDQLRQNWGFQGYVVSDCDAVHDIYSGHHYRPTLAQAAAISVETGMDNDCADFVSEVKDNHDYKPYIEAVQQGYLSMSALDTALVRQFTARMKLGMFDPAGMDPYAQVNDSDLNSAAHRALARKLADESMVLLKNDGTLPLKAGIRTIAVVGPLADQTHVLLGNYNGIPTHTVTLLEGLKAAYPDAKITYVPGTQFLRNDGKPVPDSLLTTDDGKSGMTATFSRFGGADLTGGAKPETLATETQPNIDLTGASLPAAAKGQAQTGVQWKGYLTPDETGYYMVGAKADGFFSVSVGGRTVTMMYGTHGPEEQLGRVYLEKGQKVALELTYGSTAKAEPRVQLLWEKVDNTPSPEAVEAARKADVVIAAVGITSKLEGEEMPVDQPGFLGGDRTDLQMPEPELALVKEVAAAGKPLVVVLMNGSALAVNWINAHANAVLEAWYSGEEGGNAIADTLSGKNDPGGKLPVTFYESVDQLPKFEDYSMENRTYRYFTGKPLYPFGYGLSYTQFSFSGLTLPTGAVNAMEGLPADVTVTNTGKVAGDEVVQLYLKFPDVAGAPRVALRGFQRVSLSPGESRTVHFHLTTRDLGMVTEIGNPIVAAGEYTLFAGGGQPDTGAPGATGQFTVAQQVPLPQ